MKRRSFLGALLSPAVPSPARVFGANAALGAMTATDVVNSMRTYIDAIEPMPRTYVAWDKVFELLEQSNSVLNDMPWCDASWEIEFWTEVRK
jgi:hypothetical protein